MVTISHLDTWITLVLLTINILTLLQYKSFNCYHKNDNYANNDLVEAKELELIKVKIKHTSGVLGRSLDEALIEALG